ncbi:MAG: hypothetical protein WD200_02300 [Candidatus Andersenbacteria bacterium]
MVESKEESYKEVIAEIRNLHWENLGRSELQQLMCLSYVAALEFAEALRIAERLYTTSRNVQELVAGELQTSNLVFDDYTGPGDHAAFLKHFLEKGNIQPREGVRKAGAGYLEVCHSLSDEVRAMSVFSREEELAGIFARILEAAEWFGADLAAYRYFLESHIRLDSQEGGHHDLTKEFPIDSRVGDFYRARLDMYRSLPGLF